ncbi:hypothetical protein [Aquimonas sp.]|jgi:hypothetical protein|uniref:hypothetical protein n=1 Tax=Aquimonas sp. TaxID=1872588 RepID=UPI0037C18B49
MAEALRRLPAAEPSAELDARILALAHAALATAPAVTRRSPRPRSRWLAMGSVAGAVLAAGIGWQLAEHGPGSVEPAPAPRESQTRSAALEESMQIEVIQRPAAAPASPEPTGVERAKLIDAEASRLGRAAAPARADAQSPPPAAIEPQMAPAAAAPPAPSPATPPEPAPPPEPALAAEARAAPLGGADQAEAGAAADTRLEAIEVTGSRIRAADNVDAHGFPPLQLDARLPPTEWLERVRARRAAGQAEQARRSLQEFVRSYPYLVVPADLRPLLSEPR